MGVSDRPVAIVTGGATGVGAATARWLCEHGHDVVINYRRSDAEAHETAEDCNARGADVLCVQGDVAVDEDCRRIAKAATDRWGRIDVLINSAGTTLFRPMDDLGALDADDFHAIYSVNTVGPFQMVRAAAMALREANGSVVNISSIAGTNGSGSSYAYAASKGALNTLTLSLARTLAPDIRVNALLPGMIDGRWLREGLGEAGFEKSTAHYAARSALQKISTPDQIAEAAGWLAISAPTMTGQLITIDAGLTLGRPLTLSK